ncbi:MAG: magnesium transporter [Candidatus Pacebacteria bacterium]|nr:magnesium transporter [Candidatus Paceibacterota bacterium]
MEHNDISLRQAGRLLTDKIPTVNERETIAEAEAFIIKNSKELETINYIYAINEKKELKGVLSIRELFQSPKSTKIAEVIKRRDVISVRPHTDKSRVALLAFENNLKEIPVTEADGKLLGVVTYNKILEILNEEHVEQVLKAAGINKFEKQAESIIGASSLTIIKKRLPWLILGIAGSTLAAGIINYFEGSLEKIILLALFIPAVTYISGAVGNQSETIFIRTIALDRNFNILKYLKRELLVWLGMSIPLSIVIFTISILLWHTLIVSLTLAITVFISILVSMMIAVIQPWLFAKIKIDPAVIGGPLDTIVSDLISIIVYFSTATFLLNFLQ